MSSLASDCPACGVRSSRVHSRYERRLADTAAGGQETLVHLRVRRFFCRNDPCASTTFAEQVPGPDQPLRAPQQRAEQDAAGDRAGPGRPGRCPAERPAGLFSRSTLLRLIRALPDPCAGTPRVLGVDDFASRRGHVYGTVLVDIETRRPVDMFPERSADSFRAWLDARPGVGVICGIAADATPRAPPAGRRSPSRWPIGAIC